VDLVSTLEKNGTRSIALERPYLVQYQSLVIGRGRGRGGCIDVDEVLKRRLSEEKGIQLGNNVDRGS